MKDSDAELSSEEEEDADMIRLRQNFRKTNIKTDEDGAVCITPKRAAVIANQIMDDWIKAGVIQKRRV